MKRILNDLGIFGTVISEKHKQNTMNSINDLFIANISESLDEINIADSVNLYNNV